jgi:hypothetical protein
MAAKCANAWREMRECLERLRVWQTEILMTPHGMDTFAEDARMQP